MPPILSALLELRWAESVLINLLEVLRGYDADFVVLAAETAAAVGHGVDVQLRCRWLAGEFTKALCKDFLKVVVQVILFAKEHNSAPGDWRDGLVHLQ